MKSKFLFLIILFCTLPVIAQNTDEQALKSLIKTMTDAQTNFDASTLDAIFTPDYIEVSPFGEFDPREKVLGFYKPELKPPADKMSTALQIDEYSIRVYEKTAVVIAKLTYSITAEGKAMPPRSMRVTLVCLRGKSGWKIASAQYTGIRPPQQPSQPNR